jgi:uncharacterized membrane protein
MMRIVGWGHAVFCVVLIALGIQGVVKGDFTAVWAPVPKGVPARELLAYLCAGISCGCGVGMLSRRAAATATRVLLVSVLLWLVFVRVVAMLRAFNVNSWFACAETTVVLAAAWSLYARFATDWDKQRLGFAVGSKGVRVARTLYGLALLPFGFAHFAYVQETASLVPKWLPFHLAWAYGTGAAFIAAGVAVIGGVVGRLAAALSALQMGLFTLLVWVPIIAAGSRDPFHWSELAISLALSAGAWVIVDSYA